ncbi:MAG: 3-oxoacyl-ACP reductase FabG [Thermodesulfobacteriota bacterium]|nr:3-oxoacyl-ACP reductase FabG [Thermodesulfobacteriota bacterium]
MTEKVDMTKQIALVTGASRGIGRAIAIALAESGRFVYINYASNKTAAEETLREIEDKNGAGKLLCFDVRDKEKSEDAVKRILKEKGRIDILVNNAGIRDDMLMVWMKEKNWQNILDTNLTGFFNVTRLIAKNMLPKRFGRIINISSASGQVGMAGQVNYSASKAGLIGATQALAKEIAKRDITVNCLAPGFIETDMIEGLPLEEISKSIPAGRLGKPEEVAAAVLFLCSDGAAYITGQVLGINGGIV